MYLEGCKPHQPVHSVVVRRNETGASVHISGLSHHTSHVTWHHTLTEIRSERTWLEPYLARKLILCTPIPSSVSGARQQRTPPPHEQPRTLPVFFGRMKHGSGLKDHLMPILRHRAKGTVGVHDSEGVKRGVHDLWCGYVTRCNAAPRMQHHAWCHQPHPHCTTITSDCPRLATRETHLPSRYEVHHDRHASRGEQERNACQHTPAPHSGDNSGLA